MIHLWMGSTKVESFTVHNLNQEYDIAHADAQRWANDHGEPVELWDYEGHETIDDGEYLGTVQPQPLQLGLLPKCDLVLAGVG